MLDRYVHEKINFCTENSIFSSNLKGASVNPAFKKKMKDFKKITTDPFVFYLIYLKYVKDVFAIKLRLSLIKSYLNISVDFARYLMQNTA